MRTEYRVPEQWLLKAKGCWCFFYLEKFNKEWCSARLEGNGLVLSVTAQPQLPISSCIEQEGLFYLKLP